MQLVRRPKDVEVNQAMKAERRGAFSFPGSALCLWVFLGMLG
jgi:hypothetical protein